MMQLFEGWFGETMGPVAAVISLIAVIVLLFVILWLIYKAANRPRDAAGKRSRQARLAVTDAAAIDGRRRLVLVRRDDVEHLIMIGGPTDIVIEDDIRRLSAARPRAAADSEQAKRAAAQQQATRRASDTNTAPRELSPAQATAQKTTQPAPASAAAVKPVDAAAQNQVTLGKPQSAMANTASDASSVKSGLAMPENVGQLKGTAQPLAKPAAIPLQPEKTDIDKSWENALVKDSKSASK